jgi:hypothetical protein
MSTKAETLVAEIAAHPNFAACTKLRDLALEKRRGDVAQASADLVMAIIMLSAKAANPAQFLADVADGIKDNPLVQEIRGAVH